MNFEDWMLHRGLSKSSVEKYANAIRGPMSAWAIEHKLVAGPLTSFNSEAAFREVALQIRALEIFQQRDGKGRNMYSSALNKFTEYLAEGHGNDAAVDIDVILEDDGLSKTERVDLVMSRIGQGKFRQKLLTYWQACAVTGYRDTGLLVASHIKPWRDCTSAERLNLYNGLLLTPNLDKAFDSGLVTFTKKGPIALSPLLTEPGKFGITAAMRVELTAQHEPFMSFHRDAVFRYR
ncbi:MAG: HNH endonuclease signature motif containing protein [Hydrogenophaga sp.]|nr:HNH endonuclease signature motif containing protein [Hydrogenophaga sp.]